jgi:hypothetical protein
VAEGGSGWLGTSWAREKAGLGVGRGGWARGGSGWLGVAGGGSGQRVESRE